MTLEEKIEEAKIQYEQGDILAIEKLIKENQKLAFSVAQKYYSSIKQEAEDINSIATLALFHAFMTFDSSKGFKFSTFATTVIKNQLNEELRLQRTDKRKINTYDIESLDASVDDDDERTLSNFVADESADFRTSAIDEIFFEELEKKLFRFLTIREQKTFEFVTERISFEELKKYFDRTDRSLQQFVMLTKKKFKAINFYKNANEGQKNSTDIQFTEEEKFFGKQMARYIYENKFPSMDFVVQYGKNNDKISIIKKIVKDLYNIEQKHITKVFYLRYILSEEEFFLCYQLCKMNKSAKQLSKDLIFDNTDFDKVLNLTAKKLVLSKNIYQDYFVKFLSKEEIARKRNIDFAQVERNMRFVSYMKMDIPSKLPNIRFSFPIDMYNPTTYTKAIKSIYGTKVFCDKDKLEILKKCFRDVCFQILKYKYFENKPSNKIMKLLNLSKTQFAGKDRGIKVKLAKIYNIYTLIQRGYSITEVGERYKFNPQSLLKQYTIGVMLFSKDALLSVPLCYVNDKEMLANQQKSYINSLPFKEKTFEEKIAKIATIFRDAKVEVLRKFIANEPLDKQDKNKINKIIIRLNGVYAVYLTEKLGYTDPIVQQAVENLGENKIQGSLELAEYLFEDKPLSKTHILHIATPEENNEMHKQKLIDIWKGFDITQEGVYERMKDIVATETYEMFKFKYVEGKRYNEHIKDGKNEGRKYQKLNDHFVNLMKSMEFCYEHYLDKGEDWIAQELGLRPEWSSIYYTRAKHLLTGEPLENDQQRALLRVRQYFNKGTDDKQMLKEIQSVLTYYEYTFFDLYFLKQLGTKEIREIINQEFGYKSEKTIGNLPRVVSSKIKNNCYQRDRQANTESKEHK